MRTSLLVLGAACVSASVVSVVACGSGKTLKSPASDGQFDDSDQPGTGSTQKPVGEAGADGGDAASSLPSVTLPNGAPGIGFNDLRFSATLGKVIVPAGRTGNIILVDPATLATTAVGGFSTATGFDGGRTDGPTSADEGAGFVFAVDSSARKLDVVDPVGKAITSSIDLADTPEYARYVAPKSEVWITEPATQSIEIFALTGAPPTAKHAAFITLGATPASIVIDAARSVAYVNVGQKTAVLDLGLRTIVEQWSNGCTNARGLALDTARGFLFVACDDGKLSALDTALSGKILSSVDTGPGVNVIAFDAAKAHLYVASAGPGSMAIFSASAKGQIASLGVVNTSVGASCVTTDGLGNAYVCDPAHGQLLVVRDAFP